MRSYQKRATVELERRRKDFAETENHVRGTKWARGYTEPGRTKNRKR